MRSIEEFRTEIRFSDAAVDDLRRRLRQTRWPVVPRAEDWAYGTPHEPLQRLLEYWDSGFDWQRWLQELNRHPHYLLPVPAAADHRRVHAVILRSAAGLRPPVVMAHGWPGSFVEFLGVAERLAAPERFGGAPHEGATVILLSLPGTVMSSAPAVPVGPRAIAADWHAVITRTLGIDLFLMHGGDWGAAVASWLAVDAPHCLHGLHLTSAIMQPDVTGLELDDAEREFLARRAQRGPWESGYQIIQGTKPATLSYALTDSPAGLAAWLLEKYQSWGAARGTAALPPIPFDELLGIISLYWFYGPGPASWIYRSLVDGTGLRFPSGTRVTVPTAICSFAFDVSPPSPPAWQQRAYEVIRRTAVDHGGHFPGLDATVALAGDIASYSADLANRALTG
jgi:pimeloyl-ACP methyl ester carboxylesterase